MGDLPETFFEKDGKVTRRGSHPRLRYLTKAPQSAAVFGTPVHASFPHMLWKFQTQVALGQVTRSRQVTSPQKK